MFNRNARKKTGFADFLSADYAGDYITQGLPYAGQIDRAAGFLRAADYVLLGAGTGMSAAAGAQYGGKFFEENFGEFQKAYGKGPYMQDMYSAGFYPYPDEESRWAYFSHMALIAGIDLDVTPLHRTLLEALQGKKLFLLTTNVDGQFEKAGLPPGADFRHPGQLPEDPVQAGLPPQDLRRRGDVPPDGPGAEGRTDPLPHGSPLPGLRRRDGHESAQRQLLRGG